MVRFDLGGVGRHLEVVRSDRPVTHAWSTSALVPQVIVNSEITCVLYSCTVHICSLVFREVSMYVNLLDDVD